MDLASYALSKKIAESAVSGVASMTIDGTTLVINTNDGNVLRMNFPIPADGKDGKDGTDGKDGIDGYSPLRWQYVEGTVTPNSLYNYANNTVDNAGTQYTTLSYVLNGEKKIRFSGTTSGSSAKLGYAFMDEDGNPVQIPDFISGENFRNVILEVPDNAYIVHINGNNYVSPHLEVAVEDSISELSTLSYLLNNFGKRLQYKETFAWKPMSKAHIAFVFDDSLDDTANIVDLFIEKGVPCCFGAIPEKLSMSLENGETIAQAMQRGVNAVDCEVLAHGASGSEIVTEDNIDDVNFLYTKFVINKQKFVDLGFAVRGTVRVGGSGNICNDSRTDEWMRLFFDYGDLYGLEEPYNHARFSGSTKSDYISAIDKAVADKTFTPLLFHQCPDFMPELIDYAISKGAIICNYAYAYDTYGSTVKDVEIERRLSALEGIENGNEVKY